MAKKFSQTIFSENPYGTKLHTDALLFCPAAETALGDVIAISGIPQPYRILRGQER